MAFRAGIRSQAAVALLLAGCGGGPQPADWQLNAVQAMQSFERHYLLGDAKAAEDDFALARSELGRTGRADLVARVELRRCAVRAAGLEFDECPGLQALGEAAGK